MFFVYPNHSIKDIWIFKILNFFDDNFIRKGLFRLKYETLGNSGNNVGLIGGKILKN